MHFRTITIGGALAWAAAQPLSAQLSGPPLDSLLARYGRGDAQAHRELENVGWGWIKTLATNPLRDTSDAHTVARTMLALGGTPAPDQPPDENQRAWRGTVVAALTFALSKDSGDVWSATQLERLAPYPFIWMSPTDELTTLRALQRRQLTVPPPLSIARIRLELECGSVDSAASALARLPANSISTARREHLAAEIAFAQRRDTAGSEAYYRGAGSIRDSADAAWFTRDLLWIATADQLAAWNKLAPAAREEWLEQFWNRRDMLDGQLPGTRLPEQFRRWRIALKEFRWQYDNSSVRGVIIPREDGAEYNPFGADLPFPKDPTISGLVFLNRMRPLSQVLDDRGGLILRHGEPTTRVNLPGVDAFSEETMMWQTPDGPLIVSFSRTTDGLPGSQRFGMLARNYPVGDMMGNCTVDPRLCTLAADVSLGRVNAGSYAKASNIIHDYIRMRDTAEQSDGNPERFDRDLHAIVQAYGIPDLGTLVVFALPAERLLLPGADHHSTDIGARLRVIAGNVERGEFAAVLDTIRSWKLATTPDKSSAVTGFVLVPAPIGTWAVNVVLSDLPRTTGTGVRINDVPVVAFDGRHLQLSDLIIGSAIGGLSWSRDGTVIPLNPVGVWRPTEPAILSYEVDGLTAGRDYGANIEIWDLAGSPKTFRTNIGFSILATATRMSLQRELSLAQLSPGEYRVVVRVRDAQSGIEVSRQRIITVQK